MNNFQFNTVDLAEGMTFVVVGLTVVFTALIGIAVIISLLHKVVGGEVEAAKPSASAAKSHSVAGATDPKLIAVIAAAAYVAIGHPVRVRDVQPISQK